VTYAAEFPVRFGEIDLARVVYYPRYFHYFHQAFEQWFEEALGVSYPELVNAQNIGFPSVHVETDFKAPLRYGDRVRVEIEVVEIGTRVTTVAINNDSFKSIVIPPEWRERFERFRSGRRQG
jgi:4-hydroxybenzoyl-CoA thioesterase